MTQNIQSDNQQEKRNRLSARTIKNRILIIFTAGAILAVVLCILVVFVFFKIDDIQVVSASGDAQASSYYTQSQIADASDVEIGDGLFRLSFEDIIAEITQDLPYIGNVTLKRVLPSTLRIIVEDTSAAYGVKMNDIFILLDKNYKVLGTENYLPQGAAKLAGVEFTSLENGKKAVFADSSDETRLNTLSEACANGGITNVTKYDIENIANVKIIVNSRITVIFGTLTELPDKIYLALKTIEKELEYNANAHIIVNVTDPNRSYVRNDAEEIEEDTVNYEEFSMEQESIENNNQIIAVG